MSTLMEEMGVSRMAILENLTADEVNRQFDRVNVKAYGLQRSYESVTRLVRLMWDTHVRCGDSPDAYAWTRVREEAERLGISLEYKGGRR